MNEMATFLPNSDHAHFSEWMLRNRAANFKRFDANNDSSLTAEEVVY